MNPEQDKRAQETHDTVIRLMEIVAGENGLVDRVKILETQSVDHTAFRVKLAAFGSVGIIVLTAVWQLVLQAFKEK